MGGEEYAVLGLGPRVLGRIVRRIRKELLDAVDLAVQQRRHALVVGGDGVRLEVRSAQDGGAKELAAGLDAGAGEGDYGGFGGGEDGVEEFRGLGVAGHGCWPDERLKKGRFWALVVWNLRGLGAEMLVLS